MESSDVFRPPKCSGVILEVFGVWSLGKSREVHISGLEGATMALSWYSPADISLFQLFNPENIQGDEYARLFQNFCMFFHVSLWAK